MPKSHLYQLISSGQVRINGRRCKADSRLQIGDSVRLPPIDRSLPPQEPVAGKGRRESLGSVPPARFEALFEDSAMLVIDKPAGVAVHGGSGVAHGAIERQRAARPDAKFLELAHRLDRETSG
ncbi:MAG: S4 domain-containing protein, partial [Quisquiliibacterium sp.]